MEMVKVMMKIGCSMETNLQQQKALHPHRIHLKTAKNSISCLCSRRNSLNLNQNLIIQKLTLKPNRNSN